MRTIGLLLAVLLLFSPGCSWSSDYESSFESHTEVYSHSDPDLDDLWDQGYGFNNSNADR